MQLDLLWVVWFLSWQLHLRREHFVKISVVHLPTTLSNCLALELDAAMQCLWLRHIDLSSVEKPLVLTSTGAHILTAKFCRLETGRTHAPWEVGVRGPRADLLFSQRNQFPPVFSSPWQRHASEGLCTWFGIRPGKQQGWPNHCLSGPAEAPSDPLEPSWGQARARTRPRAL